MNISAARLAPTPVSPVSTEDPALSVGGDNSYSDTGAAPTNWFSSIYELSAADGRLRQMEGLRGLAVLLVFFVHFDALFEKFAQPATALWRSTRFMGIIGNVGVDLFFVLSGYLIYGALLHHTKTVAGFLGRRIQRIYPTFLVVFVLYLTLSFFFPEVSKIHELTWLQSISYVAQNLFLLPGVLNIQPMITVAWSLSYEFFFYVIAALLFVVTSMQRWSCSFRTWFFAGVWLGYLALCFTLSRSFVRALMFVVGILLYESLSSERFRKVLNSYGEIVAILLLLASFVFVYLLDTRNDLFATPEWRAGSSAIPGVMVYQGPYKTAALSIGIFCFAAYCFAFDGRIRRLFGWTPFRYLGNMSYSYYLIHGVTLQGVALVWTILASRGVPQLALFFGGLLVGFAATWTSSTLLFLAIEKPYSLTKKSSAIAKSIPTGEIFNV